MNNEPITILLDRNAHRYAQQFASEQKNTYKGKQVYLNTLAVCAVNYFLKMLSVPTAIDRGDCWHSGSRIIFDTADLVLPNLGKLECRPLLPGESAFMLPPEVTSDRLGYVAVRFSEELNRVELLGFINASKITDPFESISLDHLQSLDTLIDRLYRQDLSINLSQWLAGIFDLTWQPTELLLANNSNFRKTKTTSDPLESTIERGKIIHFLDKENSATVILVVQLTRENSELIDVNLRIYPSEEDTHLPSELEVKILNEIGDSCLEATSRDTDNYLQLEFSCHEQERFMINFNWRGIFLSS